MMKKRQFLLFCLLFLLLKTNLKGQMALYEWRDHLPYHKGLSIAYDGKNVYCATPYSIFYYNPDYNSLERLNKVNGLSDANIIDIAYSSEYQTLVVAYLNTNLDLVKNGNVINMGDIKRKPILGNKTINKVRLYDKFAYLSCGFGIVVVDMVKEEINDTWYIGPEGSQINVYDLTADDTYFYAATQMGIYRAEKSNPFLAYYGSWEKLSNIPVPNGAYNAIQYFDGYLLANNHNPTYIDDTVFVYDFSIEQWSRLNVFNYPDCYRMGISDGKIILNFEGTLHVYNKGMKFLMASFNPSGLSLHPRAGCFDKDGYLWIADNSLGLVKTWGEGWHGEAYSPNGPFSANVYEMKMRENELWVASGGRKSTWENLYMTDGLYNYSDGIWYNFNSSNVAAFDSIYDMVCLAIDPSNPKHIYAGSWSKGLMEFNNRELVTVYSKYNSPLEGFVADLNRVFISGLAFDSKNNLWVANSGASSILHCRKPDGSWQSYNLGGNASGLDIGEMVIDDYDQKWILMRKEHSILVFNETITEGKPYKILGSATGEGAIPGNTVLSIAVDLDGEIWIGTDAGVAVFYSPDAVFSGNNFDAQRILVEQGGYVQYLLENESVTAITVDGANRKWIGTDKAGVFLLSADGTQQIYHFTEDNSPLLSNSIADIALGKDGEVFIGTSLGIVGFRGDSPSPGTIPTEVYAFPNPVRPSYDGPIGISGLPQNADVKITTISGKLVYHTIAAGTQAVWNGRDFDGQRVQSGVYLVLVSNEDGTEKLITKILFIH